MTGGGGTSGGGGGTTTTTASLPPELRPLVKGSATDLLQVQKDLGGPAGLEALLAPAPQQIAPLTADQLALIQGQVGLGEQELAGLSGVGGPGPMELAGQKEFETLMKPTIENEAVMAGLGNSGALPAAEAQGEAAALLPLIQMAPGIISQGQSAAALPQQNEQQRNEAAFLDQQRRQALIEQFSLGPLDIFGPSLVNSATSGSSNFNNVGPGALWGSLTGRSK